MSAEELDNYEAEVELSLYREYRDVVSQFSYVVKRSAASIWPMGWS